jgi:hypothetical protein
MQQNIVMLIRPLDLKQIHFIPFMILYCLLKVTLHCSLGFCYISVDATSYCVDSSLCSYELVVFSWTRYIVVSAPQDSTSGSVVLQPPAHHCGIT